MEMYKLLELIRLILEGIESYILHYITSYSRCRLILEGIERVIYT
ncbi:hypothetical protein J5U22_01656 [Saccharolobus shibatae]|uniref:Uncharacterized protein n=1 Tax=Saccharolobus shibatae TaxID=2286 RepID=A0A8F5C0X5_9CREN|nr:hypothetical protein J5U22_01656 [Saccharolobus shibatae]